MPLKVSIVVATYATPPDGLERLVRSLDAQTMPADEFELVLVDDGSPDDTWERVLHVRDTRANVKIERIENSGWPSRPRNVGLELADGDYVLFMDHDDELYPDALRAGHAMAARTGADVLNGKETRTDQTKWATEVYTRNFDNAIDRGDVHPLIPTNPHKLFRRGLLMDHDIRFPEGGRVLWEDVFFCLDVARHAEVVSVLADTPFYHWVRHGETASSSFAGDRATYWRWLREIVVQTNEKLAAPHLAEQHRLMLLHQYRNRVLPPIGPALFDAPAAEQQHVRDVVTELLDQHIPTRFDDHLSPTQLGRAVLLRAGRWDLLRDYVDVDANLFGVATATQLAWTDGRFTVRTTSRWATTDGRPLALRRDGDRVVRDLPEHVAAALPDAALDMTAALDAGTVDLSIRGRDSAVTWMLPTTSKSRLHTVDGRVEFVVDSAADLDPQTAVFGRPLDEGSWDVFARCDLLGAVNQRRVRFPLGARTVVSRGHLYVAYQNADGMLSLDLDERRRSLAGSGKLDPTRATTTARRSGGLLRRTTSTTFRIPFTAVTAADTIPLTGRVAIGPAAPQPARITSGPDGIWLEADVADVADLAPGTYPMTLQFFDRPVEANVTVTVQRGGQLSFARG